MRFDKGYISAHFVTDPERMEAVLEDPYILLYGAKFQPCGTSPAAREGHQAGRPLVIISEDVEAKLWRRSSSTRSADVQERRRQGARFLVSAASDAAGHGDLDRGQVISEEVGLKLENATLDCSARPQNRRDQGRDHGRRRGRHDSDIKGRISQIKTEIENTDSDYDREKLQERLAKLAGGRCGHQGRRATEVELKERSTASRTPYRPPRPLSKRASCPAVAWRCCVPRLPSLTRQRSWKAMSRSAARIVARAVEEPLKQIAVNAVSKVAWLSTGCVTCRSTKASMPLRPVRGPVQAGVIDAVKVTRSALQNAASIVALFLTTEAVIVDKPETSRLVAVAPAAGHGRLLSRQLRVQALEGAPEGAPSFVWVWLGRRAPSSAGNALGRL